MRVDALRPEGPKRSREPENIVLEALDAPVAGRGLSELVRKGGTVAIVVPDATRAADIPKILPALSNVLAKRGAAFDRQTVVVACGTHPPASPEALNELLGPIDPGVAVIQHDARNPAAMTVVGELPGTGPVRLERHVVEADLLITIGAVRHHYFAGFGGGPKMIFPGVAGYGEIQANHARVFDLSGPEPRRRPECEPGRLEGNPVAEEIAVAADFRPPDLAVCLVPGIDGGVAEAFAGPWREAFAAAVERVRAIFEVPGGDFEFVIASGGGSPSDSTLIQAHKGLDAACRFARPGAEVLYLASMLDGPGSDAMRPFLGDPRPEVLLDRLSEGWVQYGHTTYRLVEKTRRYRISLVTEAQWRGWENLGFRRVKTADEVVDRWREEKPGATVGVMAGPAVYPGASD